MVMRGLMKFISPVAVTIATVIVACIVILMQDKVIHVAGSGLFRLVRQT